MLFYSFLYDFVGLYLFPHGLNLFMFFFWRLGFMGVQYAYTLRTTIHKLVNENKKSIWILLLLIWILANTRALLRSNSFFKYQLKKFNWDGHTRALPRDGPLWINKWNQKNSVRWLVDRHQNININTQLIIWAHSK